MPPQNEKIVNTQSIPYQLLIWLVTIIFLGGVAYSAFATKDYVDKKIESAFDKVEKKLDRIENKLDNKIDKP